MVAKSARTTLKPWLKLVETIAFFFFSGNHHSMGFFGGTSIHSDKEGMLLAPAVASKASIHGQLYSWVQGIARPHREGGGNSETSSPNVICHHASSGLSAAKGS